MFLFQMVLNKGFKTVRVRVQGLGAGRMVSLLIIYFSRSTYLESLQHVHSRLYQVWSDWTERVCDKDNQARPVNERHHALPHLRTVIISLGPLEPQRCLPGPIRSSIFDTILKRKLWFLTTYDAIFWNYRSYGR